MHRSPPPSELGNDHDQALPSHASRRPSLRLPRRRGPRYQRVQEQQQLGRRECERGYVHAVVDHRRGDAGRRRIGSECARRTRCNYSQLGSCQSCGRQLGACVQQSSGPSRARVRKTRRCTDDLPARR